MTTWSYGGEGVMMSVLLLLVAFYLLVAVMQGSR